MLSRSLRKIAAVLVPIVLIVGLGWDDWPAKVRKAEAAEPALIGALSWTNSLRLSTEMANLTRTVSGLVQTAEDPGGLYKWHEALSGHRSAVMNLSDSVLSEWRANKTAMSAGDVPVVALQWHQELADQLQDRISTTLGLLNGALMMPASSEILPEEVKDLQKSLEAWQRGAGPVWNQVLPFGPAQSDAGIAPAPDLVEPIALPLSQGAPTEADLAQETAIDEHTVVEILTKTGPGLGRIASWVYANIQVQWYLDRQKYPMAVLEERSGNDTDIAGLLIALLRRSEIPARYGHGHVILPKSEWFGLLGLREQQSVAEYLAGSGIPVQLQGDSKVVLPHTWVEAWDEATGAWVALDAAWKPHNWPSAAQTITPAFDLHRYLRQGQDVSPVTFAIGAVTGEPGRPVPMNYLGPMPLMRRTVAGQSSSWNTWPESRYGEFTLTVGRAKVRLPVAKVHGQRVLVNYEPVDESDFAWLARFEEGPPSYLWNLRPVVWIGAEKVATGDPIYLGSVLSAEVSWQIGGHAETVSREWVAGDPQSLLFMARTASTEVLEDWKLKSLRTPMRTSEDAIGLQLSYMQLAYLQRTGEAAENLAAAWKHRMLDGPRLSFASFELEYQRVLGTPLAELDVRMAFDAARMAVTAEPQAGVEDASVLFGMALGAESSFHEGSVVQDSYGFEATTTVSGISSRAAQGETLAWVCRLNGDQELPQLSVSAATRDHLTQGFDSNLLVVTPHTGDEIETYIMIDPVTGASGYYLTGGRNGSLSLYLGLKDKSLIVDGVGNLLEPIVGLILPWGKDERQAALRALIFGEVDGFAAGIAGEWDGLKESVRGFPDLIASIPEKADFLWRVTIDREFRSEVADQLNEQLHQIQQMADEIRQQWDDYLAEARSTLGAYLTEISGVQPSDPMFDIWVKYYPVGWIGGMIGEVILVSLATAGVGRFISTSPTVQRGLQSLRFLVINLPKRAASAARAALLIEKLVPDVNYLSLFDRVKDSRLGWYLDQTMVRVMSKQGKGADKVEDTLLGMLSQEAPAEAKRLSSIIRNMRLALEIDDPLEQGEMVWKVIGPEVRDAMILGRDKNGRPYTKNFVGSFITRKKYLQDAKTPDEIVALTRQDGFAGLVEKGNKKIYWVEWEFNGNWKEIHIPFAKELGGPSDLSTLDYPFTGTGYTATKNGRWMAEYRFNRGNGHTIGEGGRLMAMTEDGTISVDRVLRDGEWVTLEEYINGF